MTKKDYILIASVIRNLKIDDDTRVVVSEAFCDKLYDNNARFNRTKFCEACFGEK